DMVLPCSLQPNIIHLYEDYKDRNEEQTESYRGRTALFKEELKKGNASLKLSALQPSDDGAYKCFIQYRSQYDDATLYVEVKGER
ncbi:butyrophilin subfamily 1 member A1-like, partial [Astyanax mexicanus]